MGLPMIRHFCKCKSINKNKIVRMSSGIWECNWLSARGK
jgi:ribosomal protein L37AE/L43A